MEEKQFEVLLAKANGLKYSSLKYIDYEDVKDYEIIINSDEVILLYGYHPGFKTYKYLWACDSFNPLFNVLTKEKTNALVSFVPEEWVEGFKSLGFKVFAMWHDFFKMDMDYPEGLTEPIFLKNNECGEASQVTISCRLQSRGFMGEDEEFVTSFLAGKEPGGTKDNEVIVHKIDGRIVGAVFTCTYGHESAKGPTAWIREVAVRPEYQNKGIGRLLINQAIAYCKNHGATRAFLAADECNTNAIHLYESLGFKGVMDEREINMIREE